MGKLITITDDEFEQTVLKARQMTAVFFWAPWNGPCRAMQPILEELAGEYADRMLITKVNIDEQTTWSSKLGVLSVPTLVFFKDGQEWQRHMGALPKLQLKMLIDELLVS